MKKNLLLLITKLKFNSFKYWINLLRDKQTNKQSNKQTNTQTNKQLSQIFWTKSMFYKAIIIPTNL
jgi:hypothetical protein